MSLITLPPEMLLRIAELLPSSRDVNFLLQCCQSFYGTLNRLLYCRDNGAQHTAQWAVHNNSILPLQGLNRMGISLENCGVDILHEAVELSLLDLIKYVLDTGEIGINSWSYQDADTWSLDYPLDEYETEGATPLYLAALNGHEEAARLLLDRSADPSAHTGQHISVIR